MSEENFTVKWEVDDGYAGGSRPQSFDIAPFEIDEFMEEADLIELYEDMIREEFLHRVGYYGKNLDEFLAWAREVQSDIKGEFEEEDGDE